MKGRKGLPTGFGLENSQWSLALFAEMMGRQRDEFATWEDPAGGGGGQRFEIEKVRSSWGRTLNG